MIVNLSYQVARMWNHLGDTTLGNPVKMSETFNGEGKTQSACGDHHPINWGPRLK